MAAGCVGEGDEGDREFATTSVRIDFLYQAAIELDQVRLEPEDVSKCKSRSNNPSLKRPIGLAAPE